MYRNESCGKCTYDFSEALIFNHVPRKGRIITSILEIKTQRLGDCNYEFVQVHTGLETGIKKLSSFDISPFLSFFTSH